MVYNNDPIRRQDRLLEEAEAVALLREGEYGVLSLQAEDGGGYGIPVNYVWDGESSVYIHCAPEGRKLRCIAACGKASFCVVGPTRVIPDKFSTAYRSIILSCTAHIGLGPEERMRALMLILGKYSADYQETGVKYTEKSFHRTEIIRLDINELSGKAKKYL